MSEGARKILGHLLIAVATSEIVNVPAMIAAIAFLLWIGLTGAAAIGVLVAAGIASAAVGIFRRTRARLTSLPAKQDAKVNQVHG